MANGYRKDSIFWALTLIAVGGLFLYTNFHHDVRAWHIIGRYWPILIIFWGLSKLYAYFKFRHDPNVPAGPFITGGEIVGLVFLLIIGSAISTAVRHSDRILSGPNIHLDEGDFSFGDLFGNPYDFTDQADLAVKPKPVINIPDVRGDLKIVGWDQPKIHVVAKKRIYADNEESAKKASDLIKTTITEDGGQYRIEANRQEAGGAVGYRSTIDLEVSVPKNASVITNEQRGTVTITGLVGDQSIDSARGDVEVNQISGNATIKMTRGDLRVNDVSGNVDVSGRGGDLSIVKVGGGASVNGEFYSIVMQDIKKQARFLSSRTDLLAEKVDGSIRMESGNLTVNNVNGLFNTKTRDKDISLDSVVGPVRIDNSRGNVQLRAALPPKTDIEISNQSASVELDLPQNSSFQIDGSTRSGDVQSDFKGAGLKITQDQNINQIAGSYGKGGPHIKLSTTYGDIKLLQR